MSVAGLLISSITLPVQLFSNAVVSYTTISQMRHMGSSFSKLYWLFKNEEGRFIIWGQNVSVYEGGLDPDRLGLPLFELIISTLVQIAGLLQDSNGLCTRYGLVQSDVADLGDSSRFKREIYRQATQVSRLQKSSSLMRKVQWAVADQGKFAELVQQLTAFNDSLYRLHPLGTPHYYIMQWRQKPSRKLLLIEAFLGSRVSSKRQIHNCRA